jgi:hypothetical protein
MVLLLWFKKGRTGAHQPNEMNVMPMMMFGHHPAPILLWSHLEPRLTFNQTK